MANNNTFFAFAIELSNKEEIEWAEGIFHLADKADEFGPSDLLREVFPEWDDVECLGFNHEIDDDTLYIWDDDGEGNANAAAAFSQAFLKKFDDDTIIMFSTAYTCSKPRPGEFGGVAVAVSKDGMEFKSTYDLEKDLAKKLRAAQ